jgi:hypothetical protein
MSYGDPILSIRLVLPAFAACRNAAAETLAAMDGFWRAIL